MAGAMLLALFIVGYAWENGKGPGQSSDRDDGLNIAVERLLSGQSPYYPPDPRAGPLSVLPGSILLALPFSLTGNSAWQNMFWLAAFVAASTRMGTDPSKMILLLACLFVLCPSLLYEWISGGDMIANGIYPLLALVFYFRVWSETQHGMAVRLLAAVFLGITLASRMNFLLLLPLIGTAAWRAATFRRSLAGMLAVCTVVIALILPLYLHDPKGFTPFVAANKLSLIEQHVAGGGMVLKTVSAAVAIFSGLLLLTARKSVAPKMVLPLAVVILITPMIGMVLMQSLALGHADFGFMHPRYGLMALFTAVWAWGLQVQWWRTDEL